MFTGIITDIGTIISVEKQENLRAVIKTNFDMAGVAIGASIACSGVCLTVVSKDSSSFAVDISSETIACTTIASWQKNTKVNLERPLRMGDELGGHMVSGHVDAIATIVDITQNADSYIVTVLAPNHLSKFIVAKGSVTLDGVSLTVNEVHGDNFKVNLIPHTLNNTTFASIVSGDKVNLEIDMMARYALT